MACTLHTVAGRDLDPATWDAFIHASPQGSLYHLHGYASRIRPDWQAWIVEEDRQWRAVMPWGLDRRWGFRLVRQPLFAQYWGICLAPTMGGDYRQLGDQERWLRCLATAWAGIPFVQHNFSPAFAYPLPLLWATGAQPSVRYTYHLDLRATDLAGGCAAPLRRQIRKGQGLDIGPVAGPAGLLDLFRLNQAQGRDIMGAAAGAYGTIEALAQWLLATGQGEVWEARGETLLAAALFATYQDRRLYLMGAFDPAQAQRGAMAALMWEAISAAQAGGQRLFDFEGSMIEGVAQFFRKFGARPVPYLQICKNELPLPVRWMQELLT